MTAEPLTPCICTIKARRDRGLMSHITRTPKPGCPIHTAKKP